MRLTAPWLACVLAASAIAAPRAQQSSVGSLERIRVALAKPPSRLTLTERPPDFTVHIEERRPLQDLFDVPPWAEPFQGRIRPTPFARMEGVPAGWTPMGGVDLGHVLGLVQSVARSIRVQVAHREVQRTLADYCAAQPNGGAGIQVCSTLPAFH